MQTISKSTFLQFQVCPKDAWLRIHRPELAEKFAPTEFDKHLMEQGNEVEAAARQLFPGAVLISPSGIDALESTRKQMAAGKDAILQATFLADGFYAKCDVIKPGAVAGTWDVYEVKGTNSLKDGGGDRDHISDLAFQWHVLTRAGVSVGRAFIVHLNKDYVRKGAVDVKVLFTVVDSTEAIEEIADDIQRELDAASKSLHQTEESAVSCNCHLKGRSRHCATFSYSHPTIPDYSVHDLTRIGQSSRKLADLIDRGIHAVEDVPDDFELTAAQRLQVRAHKSQKSIVDHGAIGKLLAGYKFPMHFLDYETFAPAIPAFDGYSPYRRIPFQFSLHVLRDDASEPTHIEFLHLERSDPTLAVAKLLDQHIAPGGSVIVWHAPFERGVNKEIGERLGGAHAARMEQINAQLQDLRDVFSKQHHVHPGFRGGTSIKNVLPVLVPKLSYDNLEVRDGATASERWWAITAAGVLAAEQAKIAAALRAYCERDSLAMYMVWRELQRAVAAA